MFLTLLLVVLVGAGIHIARSARGSTERAGELLLVWVLVGYCGLPTIVVSVGGLARPGLAADILGFPAGNPFPTFLLGAYLAMSVLSLLAFRYRGMYLIGPAVLWAIFFLGATVIHLHRPGGVHGSVLMILATHALVSVLLVAGLAAPTRVRFSAPVSDPLAAIPGPKASGTEPRAWPEAGGDPAPCSCCPCSSRPPSSRTRPRHSSARR